jgi:hypothetical protein
MSVKARPGGVTCPLLLGDGGMTCGVRWTATCPRNREERVEMRDAEELPSFLVARKCHWHVQCRWRDRRTCIHTLTFNAGSVCWRWRPAGRGTAAGEAACIISDSYRCK